MTKDLTCYNNLILVNPIAHYIMDTYQTIKIYEKSSPKTILFFIY